MEVQNKSFVCHICGIEIKSSMTSMTRHLKNKHDIVDFDRFSIKCMESCCEFTCAKIKILRDHLHTVHNLYQEMEKLQFLNIQECIKWKKTEEEKTKYRWVKQYGSKLGRTYYVCNRSGKQRLIAAQTRKRMLKSQGSCKINATCTSTIVFKKEVDNTVNVTYYKTHYGHDVKITHTILNETTKDTIAPQLLHRAPITDIVDSIRQNIDNQFDTTTRKNIHNIVQAYSLFDKASKHPNDAVSVDIWVTDVNNSDDNCILLYKKQGTLSSDFPLLTAEDFALGIMTYAQMETLKKFGNGGIVCMDATHVTNAYDFNLVSVLVIDDFGEGFPVAYLISNRDDYTILTYFINAIKRKAGNILADIFMSDDANQYFASWDSVMEPPQTKNIRDKKFEGVIEIEKGKLTNKVSKINKSHMAAMNSKHTKIVPSAGGWLVTSGSEEYQVNYTKNDQDHKCQLECIECTACAHIYSCTCMDYTLHKNMCKHIHQICIVTQNHRNMNQENQLPKENGEMNQEIAMHLSTLKANTDTVDAESIKHNIHQNLELLKDTNWSAITDPGVLRQINKCLTSAVNLMSSTPGTSFELKESHPTNKKIEPQLRFHSTKKTIKKKINRLTKPCSKEVKHTLMSLDQDQP